jgi:hypothetical protein
VIATALKKFDNTLQYLRFSPRFALKHLQFDVGCYKIFYQLSFSEQYFLVTHNMAFFFSSFLAVLDFGFHFLNGLGGRADFRTVNIALIASRNRSNASGPSIISGWGFTLI